VSAAVVPRIKICGVTSLPDAQLVVDAGADALGLIYAKSVRQVIGDAATNIVHRYREILWCVGVFRHQEDHEIVRVVDRDGLRAVQLHDVASTELLDQLRDRGVQVIRALQVSAPELSTHEKRNVVAVIIDSAQPGSGVVNDFDLVAKLHYDVPVLLAGGLTPDNVTEAIAIASPWGVDVASGVEFVHGLKDPAKVHNFVTRARVALTQKGPQ
jgi:phosphoribosylanthranilate isomerase